jgi:hypothetical protein
MLVRCLFNLDKPYVYKFLESALPTELGAKVNFISDFWQRELQLSFWAALEDAAKSTDYAELIRLVQHHFRSSHQVQGGGQVPENHLEEYFAEQEDDDDDVASTAQRMGKLSVVTEEEEVQLRLYELIICRADVDLQFALRTRSHHRLQTLMNLP